MRKIILYYLVFIFVNYSLCFSGQRPDGIIYQLGTDEYIAPYHDSDLADSSISELSKAKNISNKLFSLNSDDIIDNDVADSSYSLQNQSTIVAKFDPILQKEIVNLFDKDGNKTHSISTMNDYSEIKTFSSDGSILKRELKDSNNCDILDVNLIRKELMKNLTFISTKKRNYEKKAYFKLSSSGKVVRVSIKK